MKLLIISLVSFALTMFPLWLILHLIYLPREKRHLFKIGFLYGVGWMMKKGRHSLDNAPEDAFEAYKNGEKP